MKGGAWKRTGLEDKAGVREEVGWRVKGGVGKRTGLEDKAGVREEIGGWRVKGGVGKRTGLEDKAGVREEIGVEGERWGGEENGVGGQGGSEGRDRGGG